MQSCSARGVLRRARHERVTAMTHGSATSPLHPDTHTDRYSGRGPGDAFSREPWWSSLTYTARQVATDTSESDPGGGVPAGRRDAAGSHSGDGFTAEGGEVTSGSSPVIKVRHGKGLDHMSVGSHHGAGF